MKDMKYKVVTRVSNDLITETIGSEDFCKGYVFAKLVMLTNGIGGFKVILERNTLKILESETTGTLIIIHILPVEEQ